MSVAVNFLRFLSYSSRPQWDDYGHLSSFAHSHHEVAPSLTDRFGAEIWDRLRGKSVLDFGCGFGMDVIDCVSHGIDAAGIDIRPAVLKAARKRAETINRNDLFFHTSEASRLTGRYDCILSINSFEHYLDPAGVLETMRTFLRPGGQVLVYFSPPWLNPYGAHSRAMTPLPWVHLLFPESAVVRVRSEYFDENATCYEEAAGGLGRMTVAKFKRVVANSPFLFRRLELLAIRNLQGLTKFPLLNELFTSAVRAELSLRGSRLEQPSVTRMASSLDADQLARSNRSHSSTSSGKPSL